MIKKIQNELSKELIDHRTDLIEDLSEIGLDLIIDEGVIKEIPIIKLVMAVYSTGLNIKDRFFVKKLIKFINDIRSNRASEESINEFTQNMGNDNYKDKITEKLIVTIDYIRDEKKIVFLANLFTNFVNQKITWDEFVRFSNIIDLLEPHDIELLEYLETKKDNGVCLETSEKSDLAIYSSKLLQFGFVVQEILYSFTYGTTPATIQYSITDEGLKMINGIKK